MAYVPHYIPSWVDDLRGRGMLDHTVSGWYDDHKGHMASLCVAPHVSRALGIHHP